MNSFRAFTMKLHTQDEALMLHAFGQRIMTGSFNDSLIRIPARTFGEIQRRAIAHIGAEEAISMKCDTLHS